MLKLFLKLKLFLVIFAKVILLEITDNGTFYYIYTFLYKLFKIHSDTLCYNFILVESSPEKSFETIINTC